MLIFLKQVGMYLSDVLYSFSTTDSTLIVGYNLSPLLMRFAGAREICSRSER